MTALFGGAFDPPHNGHVAVVRGARRHLGLERLVVLVSARPGHKGVALDAETRLRLARLAFPTEDVRRDEHPRTVDLLRAGRWEDPLFVVGADEFCDFLSWKEPGAVLDLARLAVATRPGFPRGRVDAVLHELARPDRVEFFAIFHVVKYSSISSERFVHVKESRGLFQASVADERECPRFSKPQSA